MRAVLERIHGFALVIAVLVSTGIAVADPEADAAFQRGREMLKVGKYAEACDAFEESQRLHPNVDAQFNIALCSEQLGKLATALALHRQLAQSLDTPTRRAKSAELAAQLEPRVPRLKMVVGEVRKRTKRTPPGLAVRVNGVPIANFNDLPIDLGMNRITAIAPGFLDWSGQVSASEESKVVKIAIDLERDPEALPGVGPIEPPGGDDPPIDEPTASNRKAYAAITLGMGGVALAGGVTFGLLASSAWDDAKFACDNSTECTATQLPIAKGYRNTARTRGNVSNVLFIAGGVAVVAGIVLYVTAPSSASSVAIAPTADAESAGVIMFGRF